MEERSALRILAHPGQTDESRLTALEQRVREIGRQQLELLAQQADLLDLMHHLTQVAAIERDAVRDRVRELELGR